MKSYSLHPTLATWNAKNLLNVPEVAEWARLHPKTVYPCIKEGKFVVIQFGPRTFRILEDVISQFLHQVEYTKSPSKTLSYGRGQQ